MKKSFYNDDEQPVAFLVYRSVFPILPLPPLASFLVNFDRKKNVLTRDKVDWTGYPAPHPTPTTPTPPTASFPFNFNFFFCSNKSFEIKFHFNS